MADAPKTSPAGTAPVETPSKDPAKPNQDTPSQTSKS